MDKKMMAGIGLGLAAVTAVGLLRRGGFEPAPPVSVPFRGFLSRLTCWAQAQPGRSRRRRMAVKAIGKVVDDLSGLMKIF